MCEFAVDHTTGEYTPSAYHIKLEVQAERVARASVNYPLGEDFIVLDGYQNPIPISAEDIELEDTVFAPKQCRDR